MAIGSKRNRGGDEYIFIDGRAMRADEVVRIDLRDSGSTAVPGQDQATSVPGAKEASLAERAKRDADRTEAKREGAMRRGARRLREDDAFALTDEAMEGSVSFEQTAALMQEDRAIMRRKCLAFGGVLAVVAAVSLCMSSSLTGTFHSPLEVLQSIGTWFQLAYTQIFHAALYTDALREVNATMPFYADCMLQVWTVFKYLACGALLALSGMLYQNTFRNPIAAPSMLGVTNGISFALLILVVQYGHAALQHMDLYYLYSFVGGAAVLVIVMVGGKLISGKGRFNVVDMILMGTIISQLLGVVITYAQAVILTDEAWEVYYQMQNATGIRTTMTYVSLIVGGIVALVPIVVFRFKLNLISFSEQETRLLGVNPTKLRLLALGCGSLMILIATLNAGQVAMASLIVPFIARAVFGSEFRKQLVGNVIIGALLLLVCGDVGTLIKFDGLAVGMGTVVSVVAVPLFVWMLAIRQRSWE